MRLWWLGLALLLDVVFGDPPNRYHPVAWMGRWIDRWRPRSPRGRVRPLLQGGAIVVGGAVPVWFVGWGCERLARRLPRPLGWFLAAAVWKSTLSLRGLTNAATAVYRALLAQDLDEARRLLAWHLVSRPTRHLTASQVAAATVESVAENLSDGVIAPALYGLVGGLPAALAYRFVNTADAMLGYRDAEHEWLGKIPARLDDALNLVPARVTALLLVAAAALTGNDARGAWRTMRRDAGRTASPNAGYPMSAMAGALGVELEKVGHYRLGAGYRPPEPADIPRALRLAWTSVFLALGISALILKGVKSHGSVPGSTA